MTNCFSLQQIRSISKCLRYVRPKVAAPLFKGLDRFGSRLVHKQRCENWNWHTLLQVALTSKQSNESVARELCDRFGAIFISLSRKELFHLFGAPLLLSLRSCENVTQHMKRVIEHVLVANLPALLDGIKTLHINAIAWSDNDSQRAIAENVVNELDKRVCNRQVCFLLALMLNNVPANGALPAVFYKRLSGVANFEFTSLCYLMKALYWKERNRLGNVLVPRSRGDHGAWPKMRERLDLRHLNLLESISTLLQQRLSNSIERKSPVPTSDVLDIRYHVKRAFGLHIELSTSIARVLEHQIQSSMRLRVEQHKSCSFLLFVRHFSPILMEHIVDSAISQTCITNIDIYSAQLIERALGLCSYFVYTPKQMSRLQPLALRCFDVALGARRFDTCVKILLNLRTLKVFSIFEIQKLFSDKNIYQIRQFSKVQLHLSKFNQALHIHRPELAYQTLPRVKPRRKPSTFDADIDSVILEACGGEQFVRRNVMTLFGSCINFALTFDRKLGRLVPAMQAVNVADPRYERIAIIAIPRQFFASNDVGVPLRWASNRKHELMAQGYDVISVLKYPCPQTTKQEQDEALRSAIFRCSNRSENVGLIKLNLNSPGVPA